MEISMRPYKHRSLARTAGLAIVLSISGCASQATAGPVDALHVEGPELLSVLFKASMPTSGDSLAASLLPDSGTEKTLSNNLDILKSYPTANVRLIGYTDDQECSGASCAALSLHRARLVRDWLVDHGIPEKRISSTEAGGQYLSLPYKPTEADRMISRRTEFWITE